MLVVAVLFLFALAVFAIAFYLRFLDSFKAFETNGIKGPKPSFPFGNFKKTLTGKCNFVDELSEIYEEFKGTERFVRVFMTRKPQLFILDPKLSKEILVENFKHFSNNVSSKWSTAKDDVLRKCSPFVCTGNDWKSRRTEIVPALSSTRMKGFHPKTKRICQKLCNFIDSKLRGEESVDVKALAYNFTAEFVSDFIWGIDARAFTKSAPCELIQMKDAMIQQAFKCVKAYFLSDLLPFFGNRRFFSKLSDKFFIGLLKKLLAEDSNCGRSDFLNHLEKLKVAKELSESELTGHTTTVVIDGIETAGALIAHCLLLLARNENSQEKLRQEINDTLDGEDFPTFDRLNELTYLEQCLYETLRIFPPLPFFNKICTEDFYLDNSEGKEIRVVKGDEILISAYAFHKDEEFYSDPEMFIPERFDNDGIKDYRNREVLIPFGDGPRVCLGNKFGLYEAKVAVAEVLRNYKISVDKTRTRSDNECSPGGFLLSLNSGIFLKFNKI